MANFTNEVANEVTTNQLNQTDEMLLNSICVNPILKTLPPDVGFMYSFKLYPVWISAFSKSPSPQICTLVIREYLLKIS